MNAAIDVEAVIS